MSLVRAYLGALAQATKPISKEEDKDEKTIVLIGLISLLIAGQSFAGTFQISGGIEGAHLSYKEYAEGQKVDQDKAGLIGNGIAPNGFEEIRYDNNKFFVREDFSHMRSYTAKYSDITGVNVSTKEQISQGEVDLVFIE